MEHWDFICAFGLMLRTDLHSSREVLGCVFGSVDGKEMEGTRSEAKALDTGSCLSLCSTDPPQTQIPVLLPSDFLCSQIKDFLGPSVMMTSSLVLPFPLDQVSYALPALLAILFQMQLKCNRSFLAMPSLKLLHLITRR